MLRYLAFLGLLTASSLFAAETPLHVRAEASITSDGETASVQCKFAGKPGRALSFTAGDAGETKFEFTIKPVEGGETPSYVIELRITRGDKVLSQPTVHTLAGRTATVAIGDGKQQFEFSVLVAPGK